MSGKQAKVWITTDFPTREDIVKFYRIPAARVAELDQMMAELRIGTAATPKKPATSRKRRGSAATGSRSRKK